MKIDSTFTRLLKADTAKISAIKEENKAFNEQLQEASEEFEAIFLQHILKEFRSTEQQDQLIPKNHAQKLYEGMLDEERAHDMARGGGIGLGKFMYDNLKRNTKDAQS